MATPAPACVAALKQATARWPNRNKSSDGIMGDAAHRARISMHNQGNAFDLTDDKTHGVDCSKIILEVIKDRRCLYAIHDRQIWERSTGKFRHYAGTNPHTGHMHVSIVVALRADVSPWKGIALPTAPPIPPKPPTTLPKHVQCVSAKAPIHSSPKGLLGKTLGYLSRGNVADIIGLASNHYYHVAFNGHRGWVHRKHVEPRP